MRTGKDRVQLEATNVPVSIAGVRVRRGDIIFGNADGVIVIPQEHEEEILKIALNIEEAEDKIRAAITGWTKLVKHLIIIHFKQEGKIDVDPAESLQLNELDLLKKIKNFPSSTVHEAAGKIGNLPAQIKPIANEMKICGYATTVLSLSNDNLWIHRAIYQAKPGEILVVDVGTSYENGYWGEIMTHAAMQQELAGLVINGCVRDLDRLLDLKFPIFSRGICIRGTNKNESIQGGINCPVRLGEAIIFPGDLIVGDSDGVVVIPRANIATVAESAHQREEKESDIIAEISNGRSTLNIYNLY